MKKLTNSRKLIFIEIANAGKITKSKLCSKSYHRGGSITRIPHHLMGLESEGYIEYKVVKGVKDLEFQISKSKGSRMLDLLRAEETC